jgi:hypothetical protein
MSGSGKVGVDDVYAHRIQGRTLVRVKDRERLIARRTVSVSAATLAVLLATVFGTDSGTLAFFLGGSSLQSRSLRSRAPSGLVPGNPAMG